MKTNPLPPLPPRLRLPALLAACCVLAAACSQPSSEIEPPQRQEAFLAGVDGPLDITVPGQVLNGYAVLAADVAAGATSVQVTNINDLIDPNFGPVGSGDLVFIIQMQGASIDSSDTVDYGTITDLNGAGLHEFAIVRSVEGNTVHLACAGLQNGYSTAGRTQVVRVPQLSRLTIDYGGTVVARPWDGQRGGVVVVHVEGTTSLLGTIDVTGRGFRAGAQENTSGESDAPAVTLYRSNDPASGAEKGEGIAGDASVYGNLGGRYGRGAPANGGGGGNSHNAGGGGGANGNNMLIWTGQGVMSNTVAGAAAWQLDPGYIANGNALANSSGGGRGGYTFSATNQDALSVGPGNALWGGNRREEVGGLGGRPVANDPASRLFMGGGGGAGDGNNNAGAAGGNGGGLVYLISSTVTGTGRIIANGGSAQNTTGTHNDAPGGGGAGGTVLVLADTLEGIAVDANGGQGGNQLITSAEAEGPGGGGGGGFIALHGGTVDTSVQGGLSGTTTSTSVTEFPVNGATAGATGEVASAPDLPLPWLACVPIDLEVTIDDGQTTTVPGAIVVYQVTVTNAGPGNVTNAPVSLPLPPNATGATWTCEATVGSSCQAASGTGALATTVTLAPNGTATFIFELQLSPTASGEVVVTVTASEPIPGTEATPANNTATDIDTLIAEADLAVDLTDSIDPATEGSPVTYTAVVVNSGPNTADTVTATFTLPAGSTFSSAGGTGWTCSPPAGGEVVCTLPSLLAGTESTVSMTVIPTAGGIPISVTVFVESLTPDPTQENNNDTESTAVDGANSAPVNTVPGPQTTPEDTPLTFSSANGNILSIADPDAGANLVQVVLAVTNGTLTLSGTTGLSFSAGDGTSDATMTFTGTLADINAALAGLTFTPDANYNGPATLTITTNDQGNTGPGGPQSDMDTVDINVTPVNDPPDAVDDTATVPPGSAGQSIDVLANDSIAPDTGETLTIASVTQGPQGGTVTITDGGTRVTYVPAPGFEGTDTFTYTISDGNGGTDTATVTVTVGIPDSDNDGIPDPVEEETGTDPNNPDTDGDGLEDGEEDTDHDGEVDPGETDPRDPDTDDGGVNDGEEVDRGSDPLDPRDDIERRVVGSGCSTSGSGSLAGAFGLLLALLGLPRRGRRADRPALPRVSGTLLTLGALVLLASAPRAWAQSAAIDVQQFKPAPGKEDVLGLHGAGVPGHLLWRTGLYLNYAHEPLVVVNPRSDTLLQHLVKNQMGFDLVGAIGLGKYFELGAVIPLNLQHGEFEESPTGALEQKWKGGLGDLRLVPKAMMLENERFRLALAAPLVLPTGGSSSLRGQDGVGLQPRLAADYSFEGGARVLANVGVNLRSRQELLNLSVGNELSYGLGAAIPFQLKGQRLTGMASLGGALGLGATGGADEEEIPLELQAGLQYHFSKTVLATLGLGRGLTLGYGMPAIRVFTGVSWTAEAPPPPPPPKDTDGDGLFDPEDNCPNEAEDMDGFQDTDGCPELDNEQDGIIDTADKCPNEAEDKDGFQDEDGCADPDNDQDGVVDTADKCPLTPEDKDGFQDTDGCPEPDNDRDGVDDADDQCPTEAEVINGVDDTDGCPDMGETKVKVTGNRILILEKVYFATNKDIILARSFPLLQQVALVLKANPQLTKVRIAGHTDDRGDDAFNMDLSQRRADNVRKYLVEEAKIAPERLESVGYGETQPVDTNKTAQGRENNRRVEFNILVQEETPAP